MRKFFELIKRWVDLSEDIPWEKETPDWEDTAPSEYEPNDDEP